MIIPRLWLLLSIPVLGLAAWLLVRTVWHLASVMRASVVARVPIVAEQIVELPSTGRFLVSVEQRMGARSPGAPSCSLTRVEGGTAVPMESVLMGSEVKTGSRVRRALAACTIAQPGRYVLRLGVGAAPSPEAMIVIGPPVGAKIVAHVLALLVLGWGVILALIVTIGAATGRPFVSTVTTSG